MNIGISPELAAAQRELRFLGTEVVVGALYPAAALAAQLRSIGIQLVADERATQSLLDLQAEYPSPELATVLANIEHTGSQKIARDVATAGKDPRIAP